MKRVCYNCGESANKLKEGLCLKCFKKIYPPVEEIKEINLKYCNFCKKIFFKNKYYEEKEFLNIFKKEIINYIKLNENYKLINININNFTYEKGNINFELEIETDFK